MNDIERDEKIGAQTYNNYHRQNKLIFSWLKEKGYIPDNPFDGMKGKSKRSIKKIRRNMTDDEVSRLFAFLKENNPNYLALCLMCYCCLIRPKEIALLKCEDIDLQKQTVHIRASIAKNDNESYRTIPDDMMPFISALDLSDPKAYVFSDTPDWSFRPGKKQLKTQYIARYWGDVVRKRCGFPMELKLAGRPQQPGHDIHLSRQIPERKRRTEKDTYNKIMEIFLLLFCNNGKYSYICIVKQTERI